MIKLNSSIPVLFALAVAPVASAHHGFAAHFYPDRLVTIEGTVKQFDFINPHGFLHIEAVNEAGETVTWICDLQAKTQLMRRGVDETLFSVGQPIVVEGFQARRNPYGCEFGTAFFPDGSTFTMRTSEEGETQFAANQAAPLAEGATRSIFGNWIRPDIYGPTGGGGPRRGTDSITPAGEAAVAAYDSIADNPVVRCEPGSPVRTWGAPGLATSIRQVNSEILIYHESMDFTRRVHMNIDEHPADIEPSDMGHSIGWYDEDRTLVIETANFAAGVLTGSILHTDQMTLVERISIDEERGGLLIEWTMHDPDYYAEPVTGSQLLYSTDEDIIRYECNPESPL